MPLSLIRLPEGRFLTDGDAETPDETSLRDAFAESDADGFLRLAALPAQADAGFDWLQRMARRWLSRICQTRLTDPSPPLEEMPAWVLAAPLFPGSENLTPDVLAQLWTEAGARLTEACAARADNSGLEGWLAENQPHWHPVGRVTFHLAENKRDPDRPFAFLATYTESLNTAGKPRHIPLGRALRAYAEAGDRHTLDAILAPVRTAADTSDWARGMLESRQVFQPLAWQPADAYHFIREIPVLEKAGLILKVPDWWKGGRPARPAVQVKLDTDQSMLGINAMLRFSIATTLDGEPLSAEDWDRIRNSSSGLLNLRGQWIEIDRGKLDQVMAHWEKVAGAHADGGLTFHEGMRFLAGFQPGGGGVAGDTSLPDGAASWSEVIAGKNLQAALDELRHPAAQPAPKQIQAILRPYQEAGFGWLSFMRRLGLGACLADDMGLGKTLQVIALLSAPVPDKNKLPALLVVPASLIGNWRAEFAKFAPRLRVIFAHASQMPRPALDALLADPGTETESRDAVVTTYGLLARSPGLQNAAWQAVILDEAQAIRNAGTAQAKAVKKTRSPWRLALTGTPIENRPGDLWSLFDFLNPGLLGGASAFAASLKHLSDTGYGPLRKLVQPYILRRMKTDKSIIPDLPDKTEVTATCGLSRKQAILYGKLVEQLKRDLNDETLSPMERRSVVVGYLVKFKQVCNHPSHWSGDGVFTPADSGKFQRLAELCQDIASRQERALIFTQFREIIDPLHHFLTEIFRRPGLILHGGTAVGHRQKLVDQFQSPGGPPFFILSVKAGGTGLTLTAASHVIHFDRWWNPAVENQATDRAFRIGQKRNVLVHKFVTTGTIEERIDAMIEAKKALATELLGQDGGADVLLTEMSNEALLQFVALDATATLATDG